MELERARMEQISEALLGKRHLLVTILSAMHAPETGFRPRDLQGESGYPRSEALRWLERMGMIRRQEILPEIEPPHRVTVHRGEVYVAVGSNVQRRYHYYKVDDSPWWHLFDVWETALGQLAEGSVMQEWPALYPPVPNWGLLRNEGAEKVFSGGWWFLLMTLQTPYQTEGAHMFKEVLELQNIGMFEPTPDQSLQIRPTNSPLWGVVAAMWSILHRVDPPLTQAQLRKRRYREMMERRAATLAAAAAEARERALEAINFVTIPTLETRLRAGDFVPVLSRADGLVHYAFLESQVLQRIEVNGGIFWTDGNRSSVVAAHDRTICGKPTDWRLENVATPTTCDPCWNTDVQRVGSSAWGRDMSGWQLSTLPARLWGAAEHAPFIAPWQLRLARAPTSWAFVGDEHFHAGIWRLNDFRKWHIDRATKQPKSWSYPGGYAVLLTGPYWRVYWYQEWEHCRDRLSDFFPH